MHLLLLLDLKLGTADAVNVDAHPLFLAPEPTQQGMELETPYEIGL